MKPTIVLASIIGSMLFVLSLLSLHTASSATIGTSRELLQEETTEPTVITSDEFEYSQRDAFLLAFFVGPWGAHRFYLELYLSAAFQLALTVVFCLVNLMVRCCWTRTDEEKAVWKALIICSFGCSVAAWWIIDWAMIAAGILEPANGAGYALGFESQ